MGTNTVESDGLRALNSIRHIVRVLAGASRSVESSTGISGAQLFVLRTLANQSGPISVNDLADLTLTHQSTVSGVVGRLVEKRLVRRRRSAADARRAELVITAQGRTLLDSAPESVQTQLVDGLSKLSATERSALADALEAWLKASGLAGDSIVMFHET